MIYRRESDSPKEKITEFSEQIANICPLFSTVKTKLGMGVKIMRG